MSSHEPQQPDRPDWSPPATNDPHHPAVNHEPGIRYAPYDAKEVAETVDAQIVGPGDQRGFAVIAWLVILAITGLIIALPYLRPADTDNASVSLQMLELQGKYLVAVSELEVDGHDLYQSAEALNTGPIEHRLCFVTLAGELVGPKEASARLDDLSAKVKQSDKQLSSRQQNAMSALRRLYVDYEQENWHAPTLTDLDRRVLNAELGWFGALALAPHPEKGSGTDITEARRRVMAPARRTMVILIALFVAGFGFGTLGLGGAIAFAILTAMSKIRSHVHAGSGDGGIYAETFAVWMLVFLGLSFAARNVSLPGFELLTSGAVLMLTLIALAWPLLRGVSWSQIKRDIGWTKGRHVLEVLWGFVCYVSTLPLMVIGMIFTLILISQFGSMGASGDEFAAPSNPTHPIMHELGDGGFAVWLQVVLVACVAAPIVEETMFRGVLYRHLRDATARWRVLSSAIFSAALNSFIFAAIHPQGVLAIPVLMSLAIGFSLAREWRGSLLAPMTMHAISNGIVTTLLFLLLT